MDPKLLILAASLLGLIGVLVHYKRRLAVPFLVALAVALVWTTLYPYQYLHGNIVLPGRINAYPLVLWTVGLTLLYVVSLRLPRQHNFLVATVIYLILLASFEATAYHLLDIRLNTNYTSLLGLGVIHAPLHMKLFYLLAGPLYLLVLRWLPFDRTGER